MIKDELLTAYWISIPDEPGFSFGFGVTAFTVEDAFNLLAERGCDFHVCASRADVCEIQDVAAIEYEHIRVNMGLILFRRSWYPCFNVGIDASGRSVCHQSTSSARPNAEP